MTPARKRLGRGLDALLGDAPVERRGPASAPETQKTGLPIEFLEPNPAQPRRVFDDAAIDELALSIKARGLLQPILVRPKGEDRYEIVAGERRWRAAQRAKLHDVPVIIRELTDEESSEISLIENLQRVDLSPIEEAEAYRGLVDAYERTQDEIARAVGKSRSHVANMMRLLKLPARAREALSTGELTMGHARALLAAPDPDRLCAQVIKNGLSVRETEALAKREAARAEGGEASEKAEKKADTGTRRTKDADTRALEADLAAALGLEVEISHTSKGSGAVTIRYLSLDQLDEVCRRLMGAGV
ncbi:MAG: ParB/RepB/Spo0J family partition protein [Parvularculaceae bacterium]